jgi:lipopolysaccharide biosynthesis glycosyltransferase
MKKYTWCFAGQIHKQGDREKMIESLKKCNGEYHIHVAEGWQSGDSLSTQEYKKILEQSIFVPCPRGNTSVDTFRLYESLEVGAIPIVEKDDYWRNLLGEHPLIETASWNNISNDINILLENSEWVVEHSKRVQSWWNEYKKQLKQKISNIISAKSKPTQNKIYDVCFCCDENLIEYAINPINAISEKNANNNVIIHFIYSGKGGDLHYIENALVDKSNIVLKKYIVDPLDISVNKTWRSIEHLSSATNLKLQIPDILKDIDRVIYFDVDTIPYIDLKEFDDVKTDICGIAMRQEIKNGWRTFNGSKRTVTENKNPIDFGDRVIGNSGVMVLDLESLRKNKFTDFCIKEKIKNNYKIPLTGGDQDLINIYCKCNFDTLPKELNILVSDQLKDVTNDCFKLQQYITSQKDGVHLLKKGSTTQHSQGVLHFIGKHKPWNSDCLGSEFWRKFSLVNEDISLHERAPGEIVDYFNIDCQLTNKNLSSIVKEIQDKKCNCNMLVFGLGKDSVIYDTVNKGYTLFLETNQAWIDLNQNIKNKILYNFPTTVKDSLPINKDYLNEFDMPDFIAKTKWDIILVDAPPGDRFEAPGRALPIYWSSQIVKKSQATVFIDDCRRDLEKEYCDEFFPEINFDMRRDAKRGEFRAYKQKQKNSQINPRKHKEFLKLRNEWSNLVDCDYLKYISKHLNQIHIPKEKFTVYNSGKKIAIVSLYTPEIADYAICSEMSVRDYCLANGYTFYVYREKLQADASANWSKARAILNHLDDHEDIVWMDSDTIIYNPKKRFEDILAKCTDTKKIIACEDIGANNKKIAKGMMLNSGVVIFRNHNYTKNIIKKWMNADCDKSSLYASGGDQGVLCDILKKSDGFGFNRKIFEMNEFNTDPRLVNEDTFILHFMAYPYELKKIFMSYWCS